MTTDNKKRDVALVVDDSPETLRLLTDALDGAGMTVMVAMPVFVFMLPMRSTVSANPGWSPTFVPASLVFISKSVSKHCIKMLLSASLTIYRILSRANRQQFRYAAYAFRIPAR